MKILKFENGKFQLMNQTNDELIILNNEDSQKNNIKKSINVYNNSSLLNLKINKLYQNDKYILEEIEKVKHDLKNKVQLTEIKDDVIKFNKESKNKYDYLLTQIKKMKDNFDVMRRVQEKIKEGTNNIKNIKKKLKNYIKK